LTEKLLSMVDGPAKVAFREIEAISLETHAKKKGCIHNPYLVYIAA